MLCIFLKVCLQEMDKDVALKMGKLRKLHTMEDCTRLALTQQSNQAKLVVHNGLLIPWNWQRYDENRLKAVEL